MQLTRDEEKALNGNDAVALAYRILVATGEATDAEKLVDIKWAHVSGVNYNTIGDAGERFLEGLKAKVNVRTTLNPMGYDADSVSRYGLTEEFMAKQESIKSSYLRMGATPSFSCIPYEIFDIPKKGTQVSFAESNAAIHANSIDGLKTNKESAFSALASAITGKSPWSPDGEPKLTIRMGIARPTELDFGLLGFFAGKVAEGPVNISGASSIDTRSCKSLCGGMGTSGSCQKFTFAEGEGTEKVDFGKEELSSVKDELNTSDSGDIIVLGSPQLGPWEIADLAARLKGKRFGKRCLLFCPRSVKNNAKKIGHLGELERAGCEVLADCCACLSPLIKKGETDAVTTNSVKGAYYLKNSNKVGINLKPLKQIIEDET